MTANSEGIARRILVVDDHPLVRERLVELIEREPDLAVAGEAEDRNGAMALLESERPDLAIVDLSLKGSLGIELIKDAKIRCPEVRILVVSMQDEMIYAERCLRAGARGYITKQEASRSVIHAIRQVLAGKIQVSEAVAARLLERSLGTARNTGGGPPDALLTDRELQVFEGIGHGWTTRRIAEALSLEVKTIETYRARIKDKLALSDSSEVLRQAIAWVHDRSD